MLTDLLCAALSVAGLAIAVQTAYRRRYWRAARLAALSLLPFGLALAGLVTLGRRIGTAVADWAVDLVFKPTVWMGFTLIACSALLYGLTRLFGGRESGGEAAGDRAPAAVPGASAPALPASRLSGKRRSRADSGLSDFDDVEEILKRRGI